MTSMRKKADKLKKKDMDVLVSSIEYYNTNFMSFVIDMQSKLPEINHNMYIYFEKNSNNKNVLCFKLREDNSLVVFSAKTVIKKGIPRTYVRLEGIEGKKGYEVAKKVVRSIIPFFQNAALCDNELEPNTSIVHIADFRTRKVKVTKKMYGEKTIQNKHKKVG